MELSYLTKREIHSKKVKVYYKVVLLNSRYDVCAGLFEKMCDAQIRARDFVNNHDIDEEFVEIHKFWYDEIRECYRLDCWCKIPY